MRILYVAIAIITLFACSPEKGGAGTEVINQSQQDDYFEMVSTQIVKSLDEKQTFQYRCSGILTLLWK